MKIIAILLKQQLVLILLSTLTFNQAMAKSEIETMGEVNPIPPKQAGHTKHITKKGKYHGVFLGFLPCKDCDGTKTTLSLKNRNNYLLVTQPAKASAREYFEKGKYTWNDETKIVTLTSRKDSSIRKYQITDEKTLTQISSDGTPLKNNQKDTSYVLHMNERKLKRTSGHGAH
ncbi:MAG: copper resistance protein NlpE N-terminal domain-containing protein [Methylococcales bacterium]|nr:copper resistance protein NlpE N-terminal domain-containing protein [Methylococcales bacterium]